MKVRGLGTEIIVEIIDPSGRLQNSEAGQCLSEHVGEAVREQFPEAELVASFVHSEPLNGNWTSGPRNANAPVCEVHGSIEHIQSINGLCPGCGKP